MRRLAPLFLLVLTAMPAPAHEAVGDGGDLGVAGQSVVGGERRGEVAEAGGALAAGGVPWRRTPDGWEDARTWGLGRLTPCPPPTLHPVVVGLAELSLATFLLLAFSEPAGAVVPARIRTTPRGR